MSEVAGCRFLSCLLRRHTRNAEMGTITNPYEYVPLRDQMATMELAVDRSRKTVTSPASASPTRERVHKPEGRYRSPILGSAAQTGVEELEIDNYAPLESQTLDPDPKASCTSITIVRQSNRGTKVLLTGSPDVLLMYP